ncbi:MAG: Mor transcription activator family protein, partial [Paraclostridium sp.]
QFENIAMKIGIDITKVLFEEFGGTSVYFPTEKMIYKEARDREIMADWGSVGEMRILHVKLN